jgi:hypothetical protein
MASSTMNSITKRQSAISSFRRIQLTFALWGVILIAGGWLHNNYGSSKAWGTPAILLVWAGLSLIGILGSWRLSPAILSSSSLFIWTALIAVGFLATWLIIFPFNMEWRPSTSAIWHACFATGYLITGYFMDRRLWLLALWELALVVFMYTLVVLGLFSIPNISSNLGLTLGLASGIPLLIAALPVWKERNHKIKQGGLVNASGK